MTIKEIYKAFDKIGSCVFTTIDDDEPISRIAHFRAFDEEGIYFMTMHIKPFYKQLKSTGKLSVCGLNANSQVTHISDKEIAFDPGYSIRLTGDVREVSMDEIKAKNNPDFTYCIEDHKKYPAMVIFVIYKGKGEIFDYDFEKTHRDHKLERTRFVFGGETVAPSGLTITDTCISCGKCIQKCSFDAITKGDTQYHINSNRCDECGDCYTVCPVSAITLREHSL